MNYYNEFDPKAAAWLRQMIEDGLIPPGEVDERSIEDVRPADLLGFTQCHFFAGIGGWSYALELAGWPADRPIWTGSCPCQPFSQAGKGGGFDDERHLWPAFWWLISQCQPGTVMGEQVASRDGLAWFDLVQTDMEASGYTCGALDLPVAGFGSPHIRQRLFWRSDAKHAGHHRPIGLASEPGGDRPGIGLPDGDCAAVFGGSDSLSQRPGRRNDGHNQGAAGGVIAEAETAGRSGTILGGSDARRARRPGRIADQPERPFSQNGKGESGDFRERIPTFPPDLTSGFWADCAWHLCRDGKYRPWEGEVERPILAVADGLPECVVRVRSESRFPLIENQEARAMRLKGYGNAINPHVAAAFIRATEEAG